MRTVVPVSRVRRPLRAIAVLVGLSESEKETPPSPDLGPRQSLFAPIPFESCLPFADTYS